ncbi:MAG TPA: metallophosphoesterase family protein, partial [Oscillospiraceae bacterium]|nr:metallophosphoesterase family protein [Oscillospiraceae bacterium]
MIYISGDTHGDLERFRGPKLRRLKKHDTLIVCGDFGFVWDGSEREKKDLAWLSRRKYTIAFVEGAHESYTLLSRCEVVDFCGGKARRVAKNVYQLIR